PLVCVKGRPELSIGRIVAVVGARQASALGQRMAALIARELGSRGYVITSGLARGVDTSAHEASLSSGTIAALAGGIDVVYPPQNEALMDQIGETGLLVSEMPPGLKPSARHFPRRNRLISGMSLGVVIIEAARRSGSLITARMALEQGREVFAVPGSPLDPRAEGANRLIRDGATLTRSADDVIEVLEPMLGNIAAGPDDASAGLADFAEGANQPAPVLPDEDARASITALLSVSPTSIDDIIRQSGSDAATVAGVAGVLLELELAGRLVRQSGQLVALTPQDEATRSQ
ncbi:MAG: DNA-protecting protein DprA, partial [Rhizobiales bacterium]|nr:DNA-protecting protein DprA [Hyphomicrobiales bacterium]